MSTQEIASKLAAYCAKGEFEEAQKALYADNATSTEPHATPVFEKVTTGLPAILEKGEKFMSMVEETYGCKVSEPLVAGNSFAIVLEMDMKMKGQDRMNMKEICLYEVKDGKIVAEQFFM